MKSIAKLSDALLELAEDIRSFDLGHSSQQEMHSAFNQWKARLSYLRGEVALLRNIEIHYVNHTIDEACRLLRQGTTQSEEDQEVALNIAASRVRGLVDTLEHWAQGEL